MITLIILYGKFEIRFWNCECEYPFSVYLLISIVVMPLEYNFCHAIGIRTTELKKKKEENS